MLLGIFEMPWRAPAWGYLLREAFDGKIGAQGADGENPKASLLKSFHALFAKLPSSEPTRSRRKRLSRGESTRRRAIQAQEQADLEVKKFKHKGIALA